MPPKRKADVLSVPTGTGNMKRVKAQGTSVVNTPDVLTRLNPQSHSVFSEDGKYWCVMLNQTNLSQNNNKFYFLQLIQSSSGECFTFFKWGRVGAPSPSVSLTPCTLEVAKKVFMKKYHDKTKNHWEDRDNFVSYPGKYTQIELEVGDNEDNEDDEVKAEKEEDIPECTLATEVQDLMTLIFSKTTMQQDLKDMNIDLERLPLGKLSKAQIAEGYEVLTKISKVLNGEDEEDEEEEDEEGEEEEEEEKGRGRGKGKAAAKGKGKGKVDEIASAAVKKLMGGDDAEPTPHEIASAAVKKQMAAAGVVVSPAAGAGAAAAATTTTTASGRPRRGSAAAEAAKSSASSSTTTTAFGRPRRGSAAAAAAKSSASSSSSSSSRKSGGSAKSSTRRGSGSSGPSRHRLVELTSKFYTLIPHNFGMRRPDVIDSLPKVQVKIALLEVMRDIGISAELKKQNVSKKENPLEGQYKSLKTDITVVDKKSATFKMVQDYVSNTHGPTHNSYTMEVEDVFTLAREGEEERFQPHASCENRQLLWHGSRVSNMVGILSQGLRIAPPEAPVTGYMFGKGVYFADACSKSANYCHAQRAQPIGLMFLGEVALGKCKEVEQAHGFTQPPAGFGSVKGCGRMRPDPEGTVNMHDDPEIAVPSGKTTNDDTRSSSSLLYNEYIVYDTSRIRLRYMVKLRHKFKY